MNHTRADTALFAPAKVIAVGGVKGGVGKSTVAAALAQAIATTGRRVTLIDLDVEGPSQHLLWDLGPVPVDTTGTRILPTGTPTDGLTVFSSGQLADGLPRRWTDTLTREWVQFIAATLDHDSDIVVLDMPAGLGAVDHLTTSDQTETADIVVHVTSAHPLALADTRRGLVKDMHARHHQILVENLSRVRGTTPDGQATEVRVHGDPTTVADTAEHAHVTYGGSLPWANDHHELATSPEMVALAETTLTHLTR